MAFPLLFMDKQVFSYLGKVAVKRQAGHSVQNLKYQQLNLS